MTDHGFSLDVSDASLDGLARRVAGILTAKNETTSKTSSPYLTIPEAAEFLRANRQRIDDLLYQRKLTRYRDGTRVLIKRAELVEYVEGKAVGPIAQRLDPEARMRENRCGPRQGGER